MNTWVRFIFGIYLMVGLNAHSHQDSHKSPPINAPEEKSKLEHINTLYSQSIKPIFENKCLVCHGGAPNFPWYHSLPLAKNLMDSDVKEGKKHIDISGGFPFKGHHGGPIDNLKAIEKAVKDKSMPPMRYWIIHWQCRLSDEERQAILNWVTHSLEILEQK